MSDVMLDDKEMNWQNIKALLIIIGPIDWQSFLFSKKTFRDFFLIFKNAIVKFIKGSHLEKGVTFN